MIRFKDQKRFNVGKLPAAVLVLLVLCVTSCSKQVELASNGPKIDVARGLAPEQVLNRHLSADPPTLDPSLVTDVPGFDVDEDLFEGLVTLSEDGSTVPGVASSWKTSPDGKTWTFHLRPEAKWSNGQPLTANDVVYGWRRQVNPATASEYAEALAPIENALEISKGKMPPERLGVEAADAHTVIVHLHTPTAYFPSLLTNCYLFPLYEPAIKQWGDAWTDAGHMVSNGPFMLTDRVINGHMTMVKNPYYWDAKNVKLAKLTYFPITDTSSAINQYLAGGIDMTDRISATQKDRLQQLLGDQVVLAPYFGTVMFGYNLSKPPFANNPKLRLALNMAIDRDIIVKYVEHGIGVPGFAILPPLPGYDPAVPDWSRVPDEERHAMAKKLYHEAGYSDAHPLETVLTYPSGGADNRRLMEALTAMWQLNLGAKVQIYNVEWKVFLQDRTLHQPLLFWDAWIGDFPDPFTFMQLFQTDFGINDCVYSSPQFDALLAEASNTNDQAKRMELFHQAEAILNQDAPLLPVYYYESSHLIKPYLKGWKSNIQDRNLSRYMYILAHQES